MIREILTLVVDDVSMPYYIQFAKDRQRFSFQPTLKNKAAPSFVVELREGTLVPQDGIPEPVARQACEKISDILTNNIFDKF
jgi:hypothetical protein